MNISISSFGATHVGNKRDQNEDNYLCDQEQGLWVVADGIGGYEGGEVASAIVIDQVGRAHRNSVPINRALLVAHRTVIDAPRIGRGKKGMGSTVVALVVKDDIYQIAWAGDSRAYLWSGSSLLQLTQDHTAVQSLVSSGLIIEEEVASHPLSNVLNQAIGLNGDKLIVDQCSGNLHVGERFLLCSDGLSGEVSHQEIERIFSENKNDQESVETLVNEALNHGGADNITAIVVSLGNI